MKTKLLLIFTIMMSVLLTSCGNKDADNKVLSEGDDTPISVVSYTDFSDGDGYFLKPGDKVAVISPSSLPTRKQVDATVEGLTKWGYVPVEGKYVCVEERTLDQCIEDFEWALNDPEIQAIYCARGGSCSWEVLDRIDLSLISKAHKPIIGYSDISTYLSAWSCAHLPAIHSSMAATFIDDPKECADIESKVLEGYIPAYQCEGSKYDVKGQAEGILIGGNLATMTAVLDTAYDCTALDEPYILFLEDVNEDYEHIHRFISIIKHQGVLDKAQALIFGEWIEYPEECESYNGNSRGGKFSTVADMISRQFIKDLNVPVVFDFPAGHGDNNYPLLMGNKVRLEVNDDNYTLEWIR